MIRILSVSFTFIVLMTFSGFGQKDLNDYRTLTLEPASESHQNKYNQLVDELDGTFQFQIEKENYKPLLSAELLTQIKNSRKASEDVMLKLDEYMTIFIPSEDKITSDNFIHLDRIQYSIK